MVYIEILVKVKQNYYYRTLYAVFPLNSLDP